MGDAKYCPNCGKLVGLTPEPVKEAARLDEKYEKPSRAGAKIVVLVLVAVIIVSVIGFAASNYLRQNPSSGSSSNNACQNGAANYPQCTTFTSVTSMTCTPASITVKITSSSCTTNVSSTLSPASGTVTFTFNQPWAVDGATCTLANPYASTNTSCSCVLSAGSCRIGSVKDEGDCTSNFVVSAQYSGDTSHEGSSSQLAINVMCPPSMVTVSGTAGVGGVGVAYQIGFVNTATGIGSTTVVHGAGSGTSGAYSITLSNLATYSVTVYYSAIINGGSSCGTLDLQSPSTSVIANYGPGGNGLC